PGVIVVHDTQPPQVDIRQLQATADGQWVQCEVHDPNPDAAKTRFEYQTADQVWRCGEVVPGRPDTFVIPAQAMFNGMVKVTAADRAGNVTEQKLNLTTVTPGFNVAGGAAPSPGGTDSQAPRALPANVASGGSQGMTALNEGPPLPEVGAAPHVDPQVQRVSAQRIAPAPVGPAVPQAVAGAQAHMQVVDPPAAQG